MSGESVRDKGSGYAHDAQDWINNELPRLLAERQKSAAVAEKQRSAAYLGGAATVGGIGLLGGALEAVDSLENSELEWIITVAVFVAVIIAAACYLLWRVIRAAVHNDNGTLALIDGVITSWTTAAAVLPPDPASAPVSGPAPAPAAVPMPAAGDGTSAGPEAKEQSSG